MTTRITSENITDATITSTDLAAGAGSTDWQAVVVGDGSTVTTMVSGRGYFVNTTSAAGILKFPLSASTGDYVEVKDYARTFGNNKRKRFLMLLSIFGVLKCIFIFLKAK